jgi:hypothetical protein
VGRAGTGLCVAVVAVGVLCGLSAPRAAHEPAPRSAPRLEPSHELEPQDEAGEAQAFYALKRAPTGERAVPSERYLLARQSMRRMRLFSTRLGRFLPRTARRGVSAAAGSLGTWTWLGPGNIGGRTRALVIDPNAPNVMYAAGVAGGVWKTTDGGVSWHPLDDEMANLAVSSLAIASSSVLYAGTGEGLFNIDNVRGAGIFKTTDAGATWTQLAATNTTDFQYVNDVVVSPNSASTVYAATRTGVFRSTNGGTSWTKTLDPSVNGGCLDLVAKDTGSHDLLLASCGTLVPATVWRNAAAESAPGTTWTAVLGAQAASPRTTMGRTSLALRPQSTSHVVYALASSIDTSSPYLYGLDAVFRSGDDGQTWQKQVDNQSPVPLNAAILSNTIFAFLSECGGGTSSILSQGWYDNVIAVDPTDDDVVWAGGTDLFRSDDGGANWGIASYWWDNGDSYAHADQHAIVFHPNYGSAQPVLFVAGDGGIFKSMSASSSVAKGNNAACDDLAGGVRFSSLNHNFGVTQFYHGVPYPNGTTFFGGTQDNGTVRGTSAGGAGAWATINGGDGGTVAVNPATPVVLYSEHTRLSIQRSTDGGASWVNATSGISAALDPSSNFHFIAPFAMDPTNPLRLWTGAKYVWLTTNGAAGGSSWSRASNLLGSDGAVSAIAVSPIDGSRVLVGKGPTSPAEDGGAIHRLPASGPGSVTWPMSQPRLGYVSWLAFDPQDHDVAYATYSTFGGGAHVWKSVNAGQTWSSIDGTGAGALPDIPVHSIAVSPTNPNRLYIGTDAGVFVSSDGGTSWSEENTGFANVVTEALALSTDGSQLYAFTHGRGAFRVEAQPPVRVGFTAATASVAEGTGAGTTNATVLVRLLNPAGQTSTGAPVTVAFATSPGTATAGIDYATRTGTLTFPAGTQDGDPPLAITVPITRDALDEDDETFTVKLSAATGGAAIDVPMVTVTVLDDDPLPNLSVADVSVAEGDTGTTSAVFTATLSTASGRTVTVPYATMAQTATAGASLPGSAVPCGPTRADYVTTAGTLTFAAGATAATVSVAVAGDTCTEGNETFALDLGATATANVTDAEGVATIQDDDLPSLSIGDVSAAEGSSGVKLFSFPVTLSRPFAQPVTVQYGTVDGTATAGSDYAAAAGTLTFAAGETAKAIDVTVFGDALDEVDETFTVDLQNPVNAFFADAEGTGTIVSDDPPPTVTIAGATVLEGDAGSTNASFPVTLATASGRTTTVPYTTKNGTAVAGLDYTAVSGTLTFAPGETAKSIDVAVLGDALNEAAETFTVEIGAPPNGNAVSGSPATGTITDDDPVPSLSVGDVTVAEGDTGPTVAFFTVSLSAPSGRPVSVGYATADGTATAGSDYTAASGTLSFPEGVATRTVAVPVTADLVTEADETFTLALSTPAFATIASGTGTATIVDDDALPSVTIADASVTEGNAGLRTAAFKVTLSAASALPVTVGYATQDSSAAAGADYQARSGTLTFAPGDVTATIAVPVIGDTTDERNEAFLVRLGSPTNAKLVGGRAEGVIKDDDGAADAYTPIATLPYVVRAPGSYRLVATPLLRMAAGAAITIAADDVVLDLQGATLANTAGAGNLAYGVFAAGRKNVTVQHGALRGFFTGVSLRAPSPYAAAQGLVVRDVRVLGSTYVGIRTEGRASTIVDCAAMDTGGSAVFGTDAEAFGILAVGPAAHVNRNTVTRTTPTGAGTAFGIALVQSPGGAVASNRVQDAAAGEDVGIQIESSPGVSAYGNRLSNLRLGVVYATGSTGTFRSNDASDGVAVPYLGGTDGGRNH